MKLSHDFLLLFCQQNIALLESVRKDLRLNYRQKNSPHQETFQSPYAPNLCTT